MYMNRFFKYDMKTSAVCERLKNGFTKDGSLIKKKKVKTYLPERKEVVIFQTRKTENNNRHKTRYELENRNHNFKCQIRQPRWL